MAARYSNDHQYTMKPANLFMVLLLAGGQIRTGHTEEPGAAPRVVTINVQPTTPEETPQPKLDTYVLSTPAKFQKEGKKIFLHLEDPVSKVKLTQTWAAGNPELYIYPTLLPIPLEDGQTYDFEITRQMLDESIIADRTITKVSQRGKVLYDRSICTVHGTRMEIKWVATHSRMGFPDGREDDAFPNIPHFKCYQNCDFISLPLPMNYTYICPDCVADYAKWKEARGIEP